jgi:hypothetical protein
VQAKAVQSFILFMEGLAKSDIIVPMNIPFETGFRP